MLQEADKTRSLINTKPKREATLYGHVMKREKLKHLAITGMTEGKRSRGKQREKMLDRITKWLNVGRGTDSLKATRDRDAWKVMIAYAEEHDT